MDLAARRQIAESLLGEIDPRGYCRCPGELEHPNKSGVRRNAIGRDCRVYLEASAQNGRGVPTVKCVHTSCEGIVAEVNHKLRSEIAKHEARKAKEEGYVFKAPQARKRTKDEREREVQEKLDFAKALRAKASLPGILEKWAWDAYEIYESSAAVPGDGPGQAAALLGLFEPDDVVWCGEHQDSISVEDAADPAKAKRVQALRRVRPFRVAREWVEQARNAEAGMGNGGGPALPGPRICPSAFKDVNGLARSNEAVGVRRMVVIEHDGLSVPAQGALLRWLREGVGLRLRAIVWTGGKSLHGWFEPPAPAKLRELEVILCGVRVVKLGGGSELRGGMGFDPATFVPSQTYRVPGWKNEKTGMTVALWWAEGGAR